MKKVTSKLFNEFNSSALIDLSKCIGGKKYPSTDVCGDKDTYDPDTKDKEYPDNFVSSSRNYN